MCRLELIVGEMKAAEEQQKYDEWRDSIGSPKSRVDVGTEILEGHEEGEEQPKEEGAGFLRHLAAETRVLTWVFGCPLHSCTKQGATIAEKSRGRHDPRGAPGCTEALANGVGSAVSCRGPTFRLLDPT